MECKSSNQSLFDEFTAQLQGVISGDISGDDLVKAIDTKLTQSDMSKL